MGAGLFWLEAACRFAFAVSVSAKKLADSKLSWNAVGWGLLAILLR